MILAEYILDLRDEPTKSVQDARITVSAIQKLWPRRKYSASWAVVAGWAREQGPREAPPLGASLAYSMVAAAILAGQPAVAVALFLAWEGMLRIGEALGLRRGDVHRTQDGLVLLLPKTKRGLNERVLIKAPGAVRWLLRFLELHKRSPEDRVSGASYASVRAWIPKLARFLGADGVAWRSHSFRRGSATHCWLHLGWPLADVALFGRWASESSCRLYIRSAEAALVRQDADVPEATMKRRGFLAALGDKVFELECSPSCLMGVMGGHE